MAPANIERVPVDNLLLDPENPRLKPWGFGVTDQDELTKLLWHNMAVNEVALSIAVNGWFENEHLVVIPAEGTDDRYIVVEGNRRLAAVRLLRSAQLRQKVGADELDAYIDEDVLAPNELPVEKRRSREELWQYLGFQHVNGVRPWDSFSKAAYVAYVHDTFGVDLRDIARAIGDYHSTVRRLYLGYAVLQQAETTGVFDRSELGDGSLAFSHLYTAVDYREFREYLGITRDRAAAADPVPVDSVPRLERVMRWLYGGKSAKPVIRTQNPDLKYLRVVLGDAQATKRLEDTNDLRVAYLRAYGEAKMFGDVVSDVHARLRYAMTLVSTAYDGSLETKQIAEEIEKTVKDLLTLMNAQTSTE